MELEALDHVALTVADVASSAEWYAKVLGLRRVFEEEWGEYPAMLVAGSTGVALFPDLGRSAGPETAAPATGTGTSPFAPRALGFESAKQELTERGVALDEWDHAVAWSVYFRSPDAHLIEITTYEPSPART